MSYYRSDPTLHVRQGLAYLSPVQSGLLGHSPFPGIPFLVESQTCDLFLPLAEKSGRVRSIGNLVPCDYGNNNTGKPLHQKQHSPCCDMDVACHLCYQPRQAACKRSRERGSRYEEAGSERQLLPLEEEGKEERDSGREGSFSDTEEGTEKEHEGKRACDGL